MGLNLREIVLGVEIYGFDWFSKVLNVFLAPKCVFLWLKSCKMDWVIFAVERVKLGAKFRYMEVFSLSTITAMVKLITATMGGRESVDLVAATTIHREQNLLLRVPSL